MGSITIHPKKIANFELKELIGTGGMANIYRGLQLSLDRPVALKILHHHLTLNKNFIMRFENEAKKAAMLHHENIVSIIDYGHVDGEYFIAMEYIEGQSLKEMMTRMKRLPLEIALLICHEVTKGLKYAHSHGLIHRDIKPANIMLSTDGRIMITDFGIAKTFNDMSITDTGQMVGSPAYMSPEQAASRPIDHRCDIFSLGIVLYEIITGEKPFKGETYQEMITSIISSKPVKPSLMRIDVTPSIENIIMKVLSKNIDSRYQDADELGAELSSELKRYVIPSSKKLIAGFLKNPIRTAERLRVGRISKHMESALYLVNLGHGRLEDASREFERVLLYDKDNKVAKDYLQKLRSGQIDFDKKRPSGVSKRRYTTAVAAGIIVFIIAFIMIFYSTGRFAGKRENDNISMGEIASLPSPPEKPPVPVFEDSKTEVQKTISPVKMGSKNKPASRSVKRGNAERKTDEGYNYPNQDLGSYGFLEIISVPKATFYVDFNKYGQTGGIPVKLSPGRHVITIEADGYKVVRKRIFTETGKTEKLNIVLRPER
ncbi:MAG: hypothetical protein B6D58_05990 [candidate division Zixibacteria bacterium 4484_95]|nr:MAG: hypothetical protein B6D58_05990 [candidate division Zixibacteria bacterium 4484_95]